MKMPIYCVKFCPYSEDDIFAAAMLNKVKIYTINNKEKIILLRTFEADKDEYFYALDWSIDEKTDEIILIGAGMKGKIYNFLKTSIFGVAIREQSNSINEIKFSPNNKHLIAAAYEDGSVCLYSMKSESCMAIYQTQRANSIKQCISLSFDTTGSYLAYGGMTNEIFVANLKDCKGFQDNLLKSAMIDMDVIPLKLNLIHNMCVIKDLHKNFIDAIIWYAESSLVTKSANGDICFWYIDGFDKQDIPFKNSKRLKIVLQQTLNIDNCNLWFIRFNLDSLLEYLTIGTCYGELVVWELTETFSKWKSHTFKEKSKTTLRQSSFSNDGNFTISCFDDGTLELNKFLKVINTRLLDKNCPYAKTKT